MSHFHIPDGVFPVWLVMAGWIICAAVLWLCIRRAQKEGIERKLPLLGIISALMIVGMTLEIAPIAYHLNLSVIAGVVLGPALGFIAVFIVDLIIAMFGHGGITVVGLNTLIVGAEVAVGFYLFRFFLFFLRHRNFSVGISSALATALSLILSASFMIASVYLSEIKPEVIAAAEHGHTEQTAAPHSPAATGVDIGRFAKMTFILGAFGWILEAAITGLVIGYVFRVRPDLIPHGAR
ncbi:MAG: energy-coupling factor ABC transporter permease [Deltaproteobacteria bacterium]